MAESKISSLAEGRQENLIFLLGFWSSKKKHLIIKPFINQTQGDPRSHGHFSLSTKWEATISVVEANV